MDFWVKDSAYVCYDVITNSASLYCKGTCIREGRGNYHMVGEHLFLNKLIKIVFFFFNFDIWMRILNA